MNYSRELKDSILRRLLPPNSGSVVGVPVTMNLKNTHGEIFSRGGKGRR